ncbi:MAG: SDR family oxidoreductase [Anaerolineaceae bacterium]|nr:SDR family oxidoreductase [Anaerolineaceae bacterium]
MGKLTEPNQLSHTTALITGASSGIGAAFARHLAASGHNLVLVGRRKDRLEAVSAAIRQQNSVEVDVLIADLAGEEGVQQVERCIADLDDLDLLVNNAGFGSTGSFAGSDLNRQLDMIHVHVQAPVRFTRAALPGMIARRHGGIINVASLAAFLPSKGNVTYSSSKDYLVTFSEILAMELKGTGVSVQALCPGFTVTEFHDRPELKDFDRSQFPKFMWCSADQVVEASLKGLEGGRVVVVPGWIYRLISLTVRNSPLYDLVKWVLMQQN